MLLNAIEYLNLPNNFLDNICYLLTIAFLVSVCLLINFPQEEGYTEGLTNVFYVLNGFYSTFHLRRCGLTIC